MKPKIFYLVVSTIVLFILNTNRNQVNCDVSQLIEAYYRCLNVTSLNESFWHGLANMNLDEGLEFLRTIYTSKEIDPATCFARLDDLKYQFLFLNESSHLLDDAESIVAEFEHKYNTKEYFKPIEESLELIRIKQKYPTIVDVLRKFDLTERRLRFYDNLPNCERKIDTETYINCYLPAQLENRSVVKEPLTNAQLERKMVCELMRIADCAHVEVRRFKAFQLWIRQFATLRFTANSLSDYLDSLVERARTYESTIKFRSATLTSALHGLLVKPYNGVSSEFSVNDSNSTWFVCLDSAQLRIDCQAIRQFSVGLFLSFKFTFVLPKGSSPPVLSLYYDTSSQKLPEVVKDDSGTNIYELVFFSAGIKIFDFNSDSYIIGQSGDLTVYSPISLLDAASGVLIDGIGGANSGESAVHQS